MVKVGVVTVFGITIFLSAFLLFQVQPLTSKFILPWFGGSPAVWTTAMLFFQSVLFAGYVYTHLITRYGSRATQAGAHVALLVAAALLVTRVIPDSSFKPVPGDDPVVSILTLLGVCVGLPYFCLSTTAPLMQRWLMRIDSSRSVFRLYALSNAGSFLALLSFPYLFEPSFELPTIGYVWTYGFWVFTALCIAIAIRVYRAPEAVVPGGDARGGPVAPRPTLRVRGAWIALPALASLAFIATTDHISHDIAPEPRVWVTTLALYLLTFIVSFDHPRWYQRRWVALACVTSIVLLTGRGDIASWFGAEWVFGLTELRWSHYGMMFLICFVCHGELYRLRPQDPRDLTEFYLCMSFGGACGGLFVALIATNWFDDYYEWALTLGAASALATWIATREWALPRWAQVAAAVALTAPVVYWCDPLELRGESNADYSDLRRFQARNFYGTIAVGDRRYRSDPAQDYRVFYSGQVNHGIQFLHRSKSALPVTYHSPGSGVGETLAYAMSRQPSLRVAIVGLGAGTLATYARETDQYDFFEINPDVVTVANQWFTNLRDCKAREQRTLLGDARLVIERLPEDVQYDVIALDAFTGSSVPVHLLTREAFETYRRHLKPDGFISVNITNRYLNLYPVVQRQAEALGMGYRYKHHDADPSHMIRRSRHVVITRDAEYLKQFPSVYRKYLNGDGSVAGVEDPEIPGVPLWTDHFSSLVPIALSR